MICPLIVVFGSSLPVLKKKKNAVKVGKKAGPPLTNLYGSVHDFFALICLYIIVYTYTLFFITFANPAKAKTIVDIL